MIIFYQILYSIKRVLADIHPFIMKLVSTLFVTALLGLAFNSSLEPKVIHKSIILFSTEKAKDTKNMFENLNESREIGNLVQFKQAESEENALEIVENNEAFAYIRIAENNTYKIFCKSYYGLFGNNTKMVMTNIKQTLENAGYCFEENNESLVAETIGKGVLVNDVKDPKTSTAMQYYSIAMLLMLILYGIEYGTIFIGEDYMGTLGDRLKLSPIKAWKQYFGKVIGLSIVVILESTIIILFTKYVYRVYWGENYLMLYLIIATNAFLVTSMGAMFTILTEDLVKADTLSTISIVGFTFLAGGFFIADFGVFNYLSPSYYARTAINTVIFGGKASIIYFNVGIMWLMTFACALVSIFTARRKRT